ncbi:MAG: tRNA glutamyl-Q(34) synthetase GluQRS [Cyanobacteria bacterium]|nr:tRNA glutamyl-Q(34) synthetase GluQRS [Cyanobacteria bacterium bin.51]
MQAALEQQLERGGCLRQSHHRGRFAPSPSGDLHLGNLRTALLSWLQTRLRGGEWLLRFDDLDTPRNRSGACESIEADLRWLGLHWDGPAFFQSERRPLYDAALVRLRSSGQLYPCHCSRRMLADLSAPHGGWSPYPGLCRAVPAAWGARAGRQPSWRLRLAPGRLHWPELVGPEAGLDGPTAVGDVVLRRADGFVAYHLATAVDELTLGLSTVLRGADLWHSTAPQVAVMACLERRPPDYWHVPLWCGPGGERLAKRSAAEGLAGLRAQGLDGPAVIGQLAASLQLVPVGSRLSAGELCAHLSLPVLRERLRQPLESRVP